MAQYTTKSSPLDAPTSPERNPIFGQAMKEVYLEGKGSGFYVKTLREVIRVRKQDQKERDEQETLVEVYLQAIKGASSVAKAA